MVYDDLYVHNSKVESCHQFGFIRPIKIDSSDWTLGIRLSLQVFTVKANVNRIPEQRRQCIESLSTYKRNLQMTKSLITSARRMIKAAQSIINALLKSTLSETLFHAVSSLMKIQSGPMEARIKAMAPRRLRVSCRAL